MVGDNPAPDLASHPEGNSNAGLKLRASAISLVKNCHSPNFSRI